MSMQAGLAWGPSLLLQQPVTLPEPHGWNNQSPISRLAEEGNPCIAVSDVYCDVTDEDGVEGEDDEDNY